MGWAHNEMTLGLDEKGNSALCDHMEAIGEPYPKSGTEKTNPSDLTCAGNPKTQTHRNREEKWELQRLDGGAWGDNSQRTEHLSSREDCIFNPSPI